MCKKKPAARRLINHQADAASRIIIEGLAQLGAYDSNGHVAQPVLVSWFKSYCLGVRQRWNPKTNSIDIYHSKHRNHALEALEDPGPLTRHRGEKYPNPRRWYDVQPMTRLFMMLACLKVEDVPHRKLTFYIGKDLIQQSVSKGVPLAGLVNKRIHRSLSKVLGNVEFGVWFQIEPSPNPPYALHAHGLFYVEDEFWLRKNSAKRKALVKAIKRATGEDGSMYSSNWLDLPEGEVDAHWITYCTKGTWGPQFGERYPAAPKEIGSPVHAITHSFRRKAKNFYNRMRPLMCSIASDRFDRFGDDDWRSLNEEHADLGMRSLPFSIRWREKQF